MTADEIIQSCSLSLLNVPRLDVACQVRVLNEVRRVLHEIGPFHAEPVDYVEWIPNQDVRSNDYNPNSVAPPEMELLRHSIASDGYTQPIVTMRGAESREVVDGFHRHRVGKECFDVVKRVLGYLPVVSIRTDREDKSDRMAATIRHNRARGVHKVEAMSDIVVELKRRFWSDDKIAKELGMEPDEVLRLTQITGLSMLFADREFSEAWEAESFIDEEIEEGVSPLGEVRGVQDEHVAPDTAGAQGGEDVRVC